MNFNDSRVGGSELLDHRDVVTKSPGLLRDLLPTGDLGRDRVHFLVRLRGEYLFRWGQKSASPAADVLARHCIGRAFDLGEPDRHVDAHAAGFRNPRK